MEVRSVRWTDTAQTKAHRRETLWLWDMQSQIYSQRPLAITQANSWRGRAWSSGHYLRFCFATDFFNTTPSVTSIVGSVVEHCTTSCNLIFHFSLLKRRCEGLSVYPICWRCSRICIFFNSFPFIIDTTLAKIHPKTTKCSNDVPNTNFQLIFFCFYGNLIKWIQLTCNGYIYEFGWCANNKLSHRHISTVLFALLELIA